MKNNSSSKKTSYITRGAMILLTTILIILFFCIMLLVSQIQGTARIVNYAGLVRGKTQRIIKLEDAGMPQDEMIADVDGYIEGLRFGSEELDLVSLDDKAFQAKMEELDAYFDTLKQEIDLVRQVGYENTNIIQKSETFFSLCDVATGLAETYAQRIATRLGQFEALTIIDIVILIFMILYELFKAFHYAKANRELKSKIYLDEATGLPNKNKCEEILTLEAEQNMAICVFDLNNLRIINNQQGHERGDLYINLFAKSLRNGVDENQFVGRCGGDEFIAFFKNVTKEDVKRNLENIKKDILKNIDYFLAEPQNETQQMPGPRPEPPKPWENYRVNLFIDNSAQEGAPVIMDSNYSYHNIFGKLEYENYYGSLKTDYTMLKPGLLHKANGGYIIFQAHDLIENSVCYEGLKKALRQKQLLIENTADPRSPMVMVSLKPEPIPLDLKVIIVGDEQIYQTLLAVDYDFRKLFKIKVEFEDSSDNTEENMNKLARFIHGFCEQEQLPHLDPSAVAKIMEYSSRLADNQDKLSTRFNDLAQIIGEAATWARIGRSKLVTAEYVDKALRERVNRVKKYDSRYMEMIKENTLLIDTDGFVTGQINGLTVMNVGEYSFGKPVKITANTYTGKSGIINIEREVELSGSSHSKGVLILTGYLGQMFAQDIPLSLTASVCFEQLYNGVDGDSASSTELYAILSSLSGIPINQAISVTGSVNQKGEIQPIGGVNDKIEGFFQICKMRGLNGTHGVIIPKQNVHNLNLSDEVIEAVKNGDFHIYAISTIEEGIELLTGVPAGKKDANGHFPAGSINYLAYEKLKKYAQVSQKNN